MQLKTYLVHSTFFIETFRSPFIFISLEIEIYDAYATLGLSLQYQRVYLGTIVCPKRYLGVPHEILG